MHKPEYLYFDLGNVLLFFDHQRGIGTISRLSGLTPRRIHEIIFDTPLQVQYESGQIDTQQFCQKFCELGDIQMDHRQLVQAASDIFWVNRSMVPLLANLRRANIPMGILSNTCDAHWMFIRELKLGFFDFFSQFILSFEKHSMKPEAGIYEAAVEAVGLEPRQIFFVDDLEKNVRGACDVGIDAIVFQSACELARQLARRGLRFNY